MCETPEVPSVLRSRIVGMRWRERLADPGPGSKFMKAVLLDKPGPPSSYRLNFDTRPGLDEALVRVCATSLNPVDYKVAAQVRDMTGGDIPTSWESMSQV